MKTWFALLLLLSIAAAGAFAGHFLADDPGFVLIRYGSTRIETTLWFVLGAGLALWAMLAVARRLLRWPWRWLARRRERHAWQRLGAGLLALAEGDYARARRDFVRAAEQAGLRAASRLALARAAQAMGDTRAADAALDQAALDAPGAALALRARLWLERGDAAAVLARLREATTPLPPVAAQLLAEAALRCHDVAAARMALRELGRGQGQVPPMRAAARIRVLEAVLAASEDRSALQSLWSELSRRERAEPDVVAAYARRAAALGLILPALDALESRLARDWHETLILAYGELGEAEADTRLRRAEAWLERHPSSPGLLLTLGRLCIHCQLWGKAREYLERGLAQQPSPALWEALAEALAAQQRYADAARCYRNALRGARGEPTEALAEPTRGPLDTRASVVEERSEHGIPRLGVARD
jgi:HemY protein